MNLKKIYYIIISLILVLGACTEPDNLAPSNGDWDGTTFPVGGGLLEVTTPSLNYVVGETEGYVAEFKVEQPGENKTVKVEVYSSFHSTKEDPTDSTKRIQIVSNEVLLKTITVSDMLTHFETFETSYSELIAGLTIDGAAISANDGNRLIGDYWDLRLVSTTEKGNIFQNYAGVKLTVSTRFAGTYIAAEGMYFRLGVPRPDVYWTGAEIIISSVDATTYKYEKWGEQPSANFSGTFYFQIDPVTNVITYPDGVSTLNDNALTCLARNPNDLTYAAAMTTTPDIAIKDDVNGEDKLIMVYGYYTAGSGPREFYEMLVKKVD